MKEIKLTQGCVALVDAEDYESLAKFRWFVTRGGGKVTVPRGARWNGKSNVFMARQIMGLLGVDTGLVVDHINHDTLDNRKENLRVCTPTENARNHRPKGKYKGVSDLPSGKCRAKIHASGKCYWLGTFLSQETAARAYDVAARELHGEFAYLNFGETKKGERS